MLLPFSASFDQHPVEPPSLSLNVIHNSEPGLLSYRPPHPLMTIATTPWRRASDTPGKNASAKKEM
jgi:hypothetical protein